MGRMEKVFIRCLLGLVVSAFSLGRGLHAEAPKLLVLLEQGFNGDEFFAPSAVFQTAGYEVVVASSHPEKVPLRLDGAPSPHWDVPVDLPISEVNPDDYIGLFVPGGYSPGFLEKDPAAVRVTRAFLEAGQPLGMVCHAPRVLLSNGLMGDRVWTGLFTLPDELADVWVRRPGRYLDQAVVRDGNLVTARYPRDMNVFAWRYLELLAEAEGGLPLAPRNGEVVLLLSNHPEGWGNWHFFSRVMTAVEAFGLRSARASGNNSDWMERVLGEMEASGASTRILAVDIRQEDWTEVSENVRQRILKHPLLVAGAGMKALLADREGETVWMEERLILDWTRAIVDLAPLAEVNPLAHPGAVPPLPELPGIGATENPKVWIAVREGFDDEALAAWVNALQAAGMTEMAYVAEETGEVLGRNGLKVRARFRHAETKPAEGELVIAPGHFWPSLNPGARQAEQPDWLKAQDERDRARMNWLLASRERGAMLVLTGLDALYIGRGEAFKGMEFSSSPQTVWSFGRDGAKHTSAPVTISAENLITVRGADDVPEALEHLQTNMKTP
jgi:protease I